MITSLKKITLDQKVSKLLHSQTNEQTSRSDQRFIKIRNTPQTTKNINHKCHIKKNLFHQQTENISHGLFTIESKIVADQKQKTIKFITQKSLNQKKQNSQYFFNCIDQQDSSQSTKTILKQKQQINELKKMIKNLQIKEKDKFFEWQRQKLHLLKELKEVRDENLMMKKEIANMTSRIEEKSKGQNVREFMDFVRENLQNSLGKTEELDENEQETVISRMVMKVERISQELQYFIDLSHKFQNQAKQSNSNLQKQISQLEKAQKEIAQLNEIMKSMQQNYKNQLQISDQKQNLLTFQLNSYKEEYETLKKRYFIMQSEFRKYSVNLQASEEQNLKEKHEDLVRKYNCLYESYKSLYEEYINRSRQTDFMMELGESDKKEIRTIGQRGNFEGNQFVNNQCIEYGRKAMVHHQPQESLCECSEITTPLENLESEEIQLCSHPKILLKDLIKQTLKECTKTSHKN